MRIVFFGTAPFGGPTIETLAHGHDVAAVVTLPDAPRGRGRKLAPTPIGVLADGLGLPVLKPDDLGAPAFVRELADIGAELFVVVAFRILPAAVFGLPPRGTVNLHASLLPDYRGAAPINRALINGDETTGLTTFFITERVDRGDIILQEEVAIEPAENAGELADRMRIIGAGLVERTVELIGRGDVHARPQPDGRMRPAPKLSRADGCLDFSAPAREIHNRVRGLTPSPGAYANCRRGPVKILRTEVVEEDSAGGDGRIIGCSAAEGIVVACGRGSIRIVEMQPPGKRAVSAGSFVCGHAVTTDMTIHDIL